MSFQTGAPPPPPPLPDHAPPAHVVPAVERPAVHRPAADRPADVRLQDGRGVPAARPARGYDSTVAVLMGPPPGTRTYVLRATETTETTD